MLLAAFRLLSRLPLPVLHGLGTALGWLVYLASPSYRRRLQRNLAQAGFQGQQSAAVAEAGKNILELPFVWCAPQERVLGMVRIENWHVVDEALATGRGLIFLTPHLGCFEVSAQVAAARMPLTVLYRPPRKAALKPLIEDARARHNLRLAPANLTGVRALLKALRQGGAVGLLPDQVPQSGEGVWANFFGQPAYTMSLPARLHVMTGAPIVLAFAERLPRGEGYRLHLSRFDRQLDGPAERQAEAVNAAMEELIARCPAQYLWSYNRYKKPAGAPEPASQENAPAKESA